MTGGAGGGINCGDAGAADFFLDIADPQSSIYNNSTTVGYSLIVATFG